MDPRLAQIIDAYLAKIRRAIHCLQESGIPLPATQMNWADTDVPMMSSLVNRTTYYKHGFGITIKWFDDTVEFDFGPEGQTDLIDLHFIIHSFRDQLHDFGFESKDELIKLFREAERTHHLIPVTISLYRLNDSSEMSEWAAQSS